MAILTLWLDVCGVHLLSSLVLSQILLSWKVVGICVTLEEPSPISSLSLGLLASPG